MLSFWLVLPQFFDSVLVLFYGHHLTALRRYWGEHYYLVIAVEVVLA